MWALAIALATSKNTRSFGMLDLKQPPSHHNEQTAWVAMVAEDFVLQLICLESLGSEYKSQTPNNFFNVTDKFAMCMHVQIRYYIGEGKKVQYVSVSGDYLYLAGALRVSSSAMSSSTCTGVLLIGSKVCLCTVSAHGELISQ